MDISLLSLISFTIITILYFAFPSIGKPKLTLNDLESEENMSKFYSSNITSLAIYLGIVVVSQFFLNTSYLISKCGGSINKNIGAAALFTFIPWLLIFAVMIAVLIIFPGFLTHRVKPYFGEKPRTSLVLGWKVKDQPRNNPNTI